MSERQRLPLPDAIVNKPELAFGLNLFYYGFLDLSDERQVGFGDGPIPWRAMSEYCQAHDIIEEQREDFFFLIKRMDASYLTYRSEKRSQK